MNQYATVSGGWFLEKKCHFLTAEQLKEYESDITYTTVALNRELGISNRLITQTQMSAQSIANKQEWGCDEKGKGIVNATVGMAKQLHVVMAQIAEKRRAVQ